MAYDTMIFSEDNPGKGNVIITQKIQLSHEVYRVWEYKGTTVVWRMNAGLAALPKWMTVE